MSIPLIPPTTQALDLGGWNPELNGQLVHVWVDPPRDVLREREAFRREYNTFLASLVGETERAAKTGKTGSKAEREAQLQADQQRAERLNAFVKTWSRSVYAWYEQIWSHGPESAYHPMVDEMVEMDQANPKFLAWLISGTDKCIDEYRGVEKKE